MKSQERGRCALFSVEHEIKIRSERAIEAALQAADLEAELAIHLQPIVELATMRVTTVEALARWQSPVLDHVAPDVFIAAAERFGLIHKVTQVLFGKALDALAMLPRHLRLSFNLSAHDIVSEEAISFLLGEIGRRRIAPNRLTFELTETALLRDFDVAIGAIGALRAAGCGLVLDDFGTGYSSLSYLRRLPIDKVKVDRSFVTDDHGSDKGVLAAIKGLCDNLRLSCVVEGIETAEQLRLVQALGYEEAQGFLLGRPVAIADFQAAEAIPPEATATGPTKMRV
jgi:predicted signal transduction protein with EAL and GGDEF domain